MFSMPPAPASAPASAPCFLSALPRFPSTLSKNAISNRCPTAPSSHRHGRRQLVSASATKPSGKKRATNMSPTIVNRQARFRYDILETYECGIQLKGTEIKSIRSGSVNLRDAYARVTNNELFLHNLHVAAWTSAATYFNHDPLRVRRLLLHKRDIRKLAEKQAELGLTLIPTRAYFADNGYLKIEIAIARGKKLHDRRETVRRREDAREMRRVVKVTMAG